MNMKKTTNLKVKDNNFAKKKDGRKKLRTTLTRSGFKHQSGLNKTKLHKTKSALPKKSKGNYLDLGSYETSPPKSPTSSSTFTNIPSIHYNGAKKEKGKVGKWAVSALSPLSTSPRNVECGDVSVSTHNLSPYETAINNKILALEEIGSCLDPLQKAMIAMEKNNASFVDHIKLLACSIDPVARDLKFLANETEPAHLLGEALDLVSDFLANYAELKKAMENKIQEIQSSLSGFILDVKVAKEEERLHKITLENYLEGKEKNEIGFVEFLTEDTTTNAYFQSGATTLETINEIYSRNVEELSRAFTETYIEGVETFLVNALERCSALNFALKPIALSIEPEVAIDLVTKSSRRKDSSTPVGTIQQMITSESNFVKTLECIANVRDNVDSACEKDAKIGEKVSNEDRKVLFSHSKLLMKLHFELLDTFRRWMKDYPDVLVGKYFVENIDKFNVYLDFNANYGNIIHLLHTKQEDVKNFRPFVVELEHLLEAIPERVHIYLSFLHKLLDMEQEDKEKVKHLKEAIAAFEEFVEKPLKTAILNSKNEASLQRLNHLIVGFGDENDLLTKNKRFIMEGYVKIGITGGKESDKKEKKEGGGAKDNEKKEKKEKEKKEKKELSDKIEKKEYMVFLFNDCFVLTQNKHTKKTGKYLGKENFCKFVDKVSLINAVVEDIDDSDELYNAFYIKFDDDSGSSYLMVLQTQVSKKEWYNAFLTATNTLNNLKVFGVPLRQLMANNPGEKHNTIPSIVLITLHFLHAKALKTEGIFRQSGSALEINTWKSLLNQGNTVEFKETENPHNVSGLLKKWIRDLPEPLFTFQNYPLFASVGYVIKKAKDKKEEIGEEIVQRLKTLIQKLPKENRYVIQALMRLMHLLVQPENVSQTLMKSSNLSIVFGPILLINPDASPFDTTDFPAINAALDTLIDMYPLIFKEVEEERMQEEEDIQKKLEQEEM